MATVDTGDRIPVHSSMLSLYGPYMHFFDMLYGPDVNRSKFLMTVTNYFKDGRDEPTFDLEEFLSRHIVQRVRHARGLSAGNVSDWRDYHAKLFITEMNATTLNLDRIRSLVRYGMPGFSFFEDKASHRRLRSHLWRTLLGVVPEERALWIERIR